MSAYGPLLNPPKYVQQLLVSVSFLTSGFQVGIHRVMRGLSWSTLRDSIIIVVRTSHIPSYKLLYSNI